MSVLIAGGVSAVDVDVTAAREMYVSAPRDRLVAPAGIYWSTTGGLTLGTLAVGSCIFAIENPSASGRTVYILRLLAVGGFAGVAAATRTNFGLTRATGTGGSGARNVSRRKASDAAPVAVARGLATAIAGYTDDGIGDFRTFGISHQNGPQQSIEILDDILGGDRDDALRVEPGTSLIIRTRDNASVAGTNLAVNAKWCEVVG